MSKKVVLVGCGNMGHAMLEGWLRTGRLKSADVTVVEPADALRNRAADLGCNVVAAAENLAPDCDPALVIFAVDLAQAVAGASRNAQAAQFLDAVLEAKTAGK